MTGARLAPCEPPRQRMPQDCLRLWALSARRRCGFSRSSRMPSDDQRPPCRGRAHEAARACRTSSAKNSTQAAMSSEPHLVMPMTRWKVEVCSAMSISPRCSRSRCRPSGISLLDEWEGWGACYTNAPRGSMRPTGQQRPQRRHQRQRLVDHHVVMRIRDLDLGTWPSRKPARRPSRRSMIRLLSP